MTKFPHLPHISVLVLSTALSGCVAVGPDYVSPAANISASYAGIAARPAGDTSDMKWWLDFRDTRLNDLIERGLAQNLDIKTALERINGAEAAARATGLANLISGDAAAKTVFSGSSQKKTNPTTTGSFSAALILDIFGGERRNQEKAKAALEGAVYDAGTAQLAFLSSLTTNYIQARYYQAALFITRQTIESRRQTLDLVLQQKNAGTATDLEVSQAEALLNDTIANKPTLEQGFQSSVFAIATLLAEPAQPLLTSMQRGAPQPLPRRNTSPGVPAELLHNRPDVLSAERDLAATTAAVGVAEAALYPSINLSGTISVSGDITSWTFGPNLTFPILDQPSLRANRDEAISTAKQAELAWRSSVLSAVEEVQSAQSAYLRSRRQAEALRAVVRSYEKLALLTRQTYEGGTTTLSDLLDAERSLASARLTLASAVQNVAKNWATLQVAAGRGWFLKP